MKNVTVVVVILFVFSLVSPVVAAEKMSPIDYSVKGKVVSLDLLNRTLTIKPTSMVPPTADGEFIFKINEMTDVRMCNQDRTMQDIKVGEVVTIAYSIERDIFYADTVDLPTPLVACLLD